MNKCYGYYYDEHGKKFNFEKGLFLEWGYETNEKGELNTVAIIKLENGNVITTKPNKIKFYT